MSRARHELGVLKSFLGFVMLVLASITLTFPANAPGMAGQALAAAPEPSPTLSRVGNDVIITGSVDLFNSASFTGTNKALKQDRARPQVDLVAMTAGFDGIRARIAELRHPDNATTPANVPTEAKVAASEPEPAKDAPAEAAPAWADRTQVASIDPEISTPALDAIDKLAPGGNATAPTPHDMSKELAYAREDLPATTFDSLGSPTLFNKLGQKVSDKELWCMATAIYFEARGESYRGQVAVGQVVMNRVAHKLYPDTICGVVFQNQSKRNACQFSFACDGRPEKVTDDKAWKQAMQISREVVGGKDYLPEVGYATHYHATYVKPKWAPRMKKVTKIGMHVFYQFKRGWKFG